MRRPVGCNESNVTGLSSKCGQYQCVGEFNNLTMCGLIFSLRIFSLSLFVKSYQQVWLKWSTWGFHLTSKVILIKFYWSWVNPIWHWFEYLVQRENILQNVQWSLHFGCIVVIVRGSGCTQSQPPSSTALHCPPQPLTLCPSLLWLWVLTTLGIRGLQKPQGPARLSTGDEWASSKERVGVCEVLGPF